MHTRKKPAMIAVLILLICIVSIWILKPNSSGKAEDTVKDFYSFEQAGNFASSWELFHSEMRNRFSKSHYIQDRAHVFMNHFGVETFSFSLSNPIKLNNWKSTVDALPAEGYSIMVTQTFKSKYGIFDLKQEVFVTKEEGKWRILWDYKM